jgi:hypothetical protein
LFLPKCENDIENFIAFRTNGLGLPSGNMVTQLLGAMAEPLWSYMSLALSARHIVSSWDLSWTPLGQVSMPAAFLEHSKLQTPIPLTHIINFQIAA